MILKFSIRNVIKRPFLNLIKIIGLSLALSGILIIVLFLKNELTFDSFHKKSDRIYRFTITSPSFFEGKHFARVYKPDYISKMAAYFPEILNFLKTEGKMQLVNEDCELFPGISVRMFDGHTPGQMIPFINSGEKTYVYMADLIPTAANIPIVWLAAYDLYPVTAMEEKEREKEDKKREAESKSANSGNNRINPAIPPTF